MRNFVQKIKKNLSRFNERQRRAFQAQAHWVEMYKLVLFTLMTAKLLGGLDVWLQVLL